MNIKIPIFDQVAYVVILAGSILDFARVHYGKGLDLPVSLMIFALNIAVMAVIYHLLRLFWNRWLCDAAADIYSAVFHRDFSRSQRRERREKEQLFKQSVRMMTDYAMHHIGGYLSPDERKVLKDDIRKLAEGTPGCFQPICDGKFGSFNARDIGHLCHALGNHTPKRRKVEEIAVFARDCFPGFFRDCELSSIVKKLTDVEYNNVRIPVADKYKPLSISDR